MNGILLGMLLLIASETTARGEREPEPVLDPAVAIELFDGATLDGWTPRGGRYDGHARWTIEEGALTGRQGPGKAGGLLYTESLHRNFLLTLETKIDWPFDSGIFVRMVPDRKGAQVTLDYRPGGEVGAVYSDAFLLHNRFAKQAWKRGDWNRFTVRLVGDFRITVWMNGVLVTDYALDGSPEPYAREGRIGVQVHGGESVPDATAARFRRIRLVELPEYDPDLFHAAADGGLTPTARGRELGWRPLFNGRDLEGLDAVPAPDRFRVERGMLVFPSTTGGGLVRTERDFGDFELRLDFRIARMANSGVFLRAARDGSNPAYSGCEIQILDDFHWEEETGSTLEPWQLTGSLYGSTPPADRAALRPIGRWNTYEIRYEGSRLRVALNGRLLHDLDTFDAPGDPPFRERTRRGFLGLQHYAPDRAEGDAYAWFRNLFVRELD